MINHLAHLSPGNKVKVLKAFIDFDNNTVKEGTILTYDSHDYFVYDGGYTFRFSEKTIRLAEIDRENDQVLSNFNEYFEVIG